MRHAAIPVATHPHTLADVMSRNVVAVRPEDSLDAVTATFLQRGISGAPVVDDDGRPIGIVSKTDLLRASYDAADDDVVEDHCERGFHVHDLATPCVRDVMTPVVFALPEDAHVSRAAALMAYENVHRVPVVDDGGRLVGIVSTTDVVRWMAIEHGYVLPRGQH